MPPAPAKDGARSCRAPGSGAAVVSPGDNILLEALFQGCSASPGCTGPVCVAVAREHDDRHGWVTWAPRPHRNRNKPAGARRRRDVCWEGAAGSGREDQGGRFVAAARAGKSRRPRAPLDRTGALSQRVAAWQCRLKLEDGEERAGLFPPAHQTPSPSARNRSDARRVVLCVRACACCAGAGSALAYCSRESDRSPSLAPALGRVVDNLGKAEGGTVPSPCNSPPHTRQNYDHRILCAHTIHHRRSADSSPRRAMTHTEGQSWLASAIPGPGQSEVSPLPSHCCSCPDETRNQSSRGD